MVRPLPTRKNLVTWVPITFASTIYKKGCSSACLYKISNCFTNPLPGINSEEYNVDQVHEQNVIKI